MSRTPKITWTFFRAAVIERAGPDLNEWPILEQMWKAAQTEVRVQFAQELDAMEDSVDRDETISEVADSLDEEDQP